MDQSIDNLVRKEKGLVCQTIREHLLDAIKGMDQGQKLPSERKLSEFLAVDRVTLRKAMHDLATEGFVVRQQGRGTFVGARAMSSSAAAVSCHTIVAVMPDLVLPSSSFMLDAIVKQSARLGGRIQVQTSMLDARTECKLLETMQNDKSITHVLTMPVLNNYRSPAYINLLNKLVESGKKLVLMGQNVPGTDIPFVMSDKFQLGHIGTEYLVSLGHRRIGYMSTNTHASAGTASCEGYRQALQDYDIKPDKSLEINIPLAKSAKPAYLATKALFKNGTDRCTALFSAHFSMTYGAYQAIRELGLQDKVELLGTDADLNPIMQNISFMSQHYEEIGREAVNLLLGSGSQVDGAPQEILVPPMLKHSHSGPIFT